MTSFASPLWRNLQVYQIYGANTNVGKTVVSTLLCRAAGRASGRVAGFIKPVSTGPLGEADDRHIRQFAPGTITRCLYQFKEPVSPHLAAAGAEHVPQDDEVVCGIHDVLSGWDKEGLRHAFVETAGGVHSPGPSGTSQSDLYRPLRLPVVLVADYHLGGISSSVSAYESLLVRGYDVQSVLIFKDQYYRNSDYLLEFFGKKDIPLLAFEAPPARPQEESEASLEQDGKNMLAYYDAAVQDESQFSGLMSQLTARHAKRLERLESMATRASKSIWYPFTQHKDLKPEALTVIDSARGDQFQVFQNSKSGDGNSAESTSLLSPVFDGSASWWTQGLGHGNPDLSLGAAYAAGRYGHVMFALGAHEPAIQLAETLLKHHGNERLTRAFYSDNGSTGMEVAVKMALRASCVRYGWDGSQEEIGVLGLKGSYHGDTIGTMDCSEPSIFNKTVDWYRGRGFWFDFPQVRLIDGVWTVEIPTELGIRKTEDPTFETLQDVFDIQARESSKLAQTYQDIIYTTIAEEIKHGRKFGVLILEPIVLGAGGMLLADPLFQHILIKCVREELPRILPSPTSIDNSPTSWSGLPVVFDEVFTGLYRLFHFSPSNFFPESSRPDIVVNAKLLTGGLIPLSVTLASEEIFKVFNSSPAKEQALLHGHSYTAHPIGCHVANLSLQTMMKMEQDGVWESFKESWTQSRGANPPALTVPATNTVSASQPEVWSIWPQDLIYDLSHSDSVESVWALGSILSVVLRDQDGGGYGSSVAQGLQQQLRWPSISNSGPLQTPNGAPDLKNIHFNVQSRVLGNVFYLMTSLTSSKEEVSRICEMLRRALV